MDSTHIPSPIVIPKAVNSQNFLALAQKATAYQETSNNDNGLSRATAALSLQRNSLIKGCLVSFVTFLAGDYRPFTEKDTSAI